MDPPVLLVERYPPEVWYVAEGRDSPPTFLPVGSVKCALPRVELHRSVVLKSDNVVGALYVKLFRSSVESPYCERQPLNEADHHSS